MAKKNATKTSSQKVKLSVYYDYDLTGGGPPFGHVRTFRVELTIRNKVIFRLASAGEKLKKMVEEQGKPDGEKENLPQDRGYSSRSYKQRFTLPTSITLKQIGVEIPYESVL